MDFNKGGLVNKKNVKKKNVEQMRFSLEFMYEDIC